MRRSRFTCARLALPGRVDAHGRACNTLDIQAIHARTPQAKGRVERANQTLQGHLVKEMRLAGIHSIEEADAWLPGFIADYNRRFAVAAQQSGDAYRPLLHEAAELDLILSLHYRRTLSKNLTLAVPQPALSNPKRGRRPSATSHPGDRLRSLRWHGDLAALRQSAGLQMLGPGRVAAAGR